MLIRRPRELRDRDVTDESLYLNRREWLVAAGLTVMALSPVQLRHAARRLLQQDDDLKPTPYKDITSYNNFYEFGTGKDEPARERRHPAAATVDGLDRRRREAPREVRPR